MDPKCSSSLNFRLLLFKQEGSICETLVFFQLQTFTCTSELACLSGPKSTTIASRIDKIFCEIRLFRNVIVVGIIYLPM